MEPHRPWDPCTKGMTVEQHLRQLRFPLTRSYYHARRTQMASCGIPPAEIASNAHLQYLLYVHKMMNATAAAWNASDQRYAALLPPLPDDNTVFSAIHLASMAQTEGCLIASSLNQDARWSLYESSWQDMLLSFAEDRSVCCVENSQPGPDDSSGRLQQHFSCFGQFIWGEAYAWPLDKLVMQYRVFEAQLSWQARCALSIPAAPTAPTLFGNVQQNAVYPMCASVSSPADNGFAPGPRPVLSFHAQRPELATLSHQCNGGHSRTASIPYESDTAASASSSDASVLATPNAEANFSLWDAVSPPTCDTGTPLSPFPSHDTDDLSPGTANRACISAQCGSFDDSYLMITGRGISDGKLLDDNGVGSSPRPVLHRRTATKESPKRVIQNREKSKRYYYRRKAQRDAFNVFLDSLKMVTSTSPHASELDESRLRSQLSRLDCTSPFADPDGTTDADATGCNLQGLEQTASVAAPANVLTETVNVLLSSMASNSSAAVPRTKAEAGLLQALLTGLPSNWQELLLAETRVKASTAATATTMQYELVVAALVRWLQTNATNGPSVC